MERGAFRAVAVELGHSNWEKLTSRVNRLYVREDDIRSAFARDYARILHSQAYCRLKRKTQVFFATKSDHICTRIEHVNHVLSVSNTICNFLGLNTELANAIAIGHDLGHAPFGHEGEKSLKDIAKREMSGHFWHEKNSLRFIDDIETLEDPRGRHWNLNLTYAVRDGIICHCGEVDERRLFPRDILMDLEAIDQPGKVQPATWEGCVVKISDKISYLGRDIEDAFRLRLLEMSHFRELKEILKSVKKESLKEINNTVLIHEFIIDICKNSNPSDGISFAENYMELMNSVKKFNYAHIYGNKRVERYKKFVRLIIETLFEIMMEWYDEGMHPEGLNHIENKKTMHTPMLFKEFKSWVFKYSKNMSRKTLDEHKRIYNIEVKSDYVRCVLEFISGMTDQFAIDAYKEVITFR